MKRMVATLLVVMLLVGNVTSCTPREIRELKRTYETTTENQNSLMAGETTTNGQPVNIDALIDNETPYEELITKEIDIHEFIQNYCLDSQFGRGSLNNVIEDIGIECLRKVGDETIYSIIYSLHKVKQGGLLYVFYLQYKQEYSNFARMLRWFYVPKKLSSSEYEKVHEGTSIAEVKQIDPAIQIFENMYISNPELMDEMEGEQYFLTWQYLEDEIIEIYYRYNGGKTEVMGKQLFKNHAIQQYGEARVIYHNGEILEMDKIIDRMVK